MTGPGNQVRPPGRQGRRLWDKTALVPRHKELGSPVHRAGGPVPKRQNHITGSDPGPHRRDPAPGHGGCRYHRRRRQQGGAPPQDERGGHLRHHQFHGRQLYLHRLPGLDRIHPGHAQRAAGGRRRGGRLRSGRKEGAATAADPARAGRPEHSALPVSQQDRQGRQARARDDQAAAAGVARAFAAAANSDLERRHHLRLRRSRARARLCLQGTRAVGDRRTQGRRPRPQERSALHDAGDAGRSRRPADGAIARGHRAAARQGVRRSRQGIARPYRLSGAAWRRHPQQWRAAASQGVTA